MSFDKCVVKSTNLWIYSSIILYWDSDTNDETDDDDDDDDDAHHDHDHSSNAKSLVLDKDLFLNWFVGRQKMKRLSGESIIN